MPITWESTDWIGPSFVGENGRLEWWSGGPDSVRHRIGGPAIIKPNGSQEWWADGKLHRVGGPACSYADGRHEWWFHGTLHRIDGPAVYYVEGDSITNEVWYWYGEQCPDPRFIDDDF